MSDYVNHNPDILTCLANLSNDEVFTPPELANQVLDLIPEDFWRDPNVKVLDPACKSGVFLRECAKRFLKGLEPVYPDLQERIDHIFQKQLFGYAITELTSYMSRRSVYCSKTADGKYSITNFERDWGNINYKNVDHTWKDGKCTFCGVSKEVYGKGKGRESYAYRFIHLSEKKLKELQDMKFDLIISNPPYQLSDGGNSASATPIYQKFVKQAKKLNPRYMTMITPSRWFTGGKGLDDYRVEMLSDKRIRKMVDYQNAKDCFPGVSIGGGVSYFLWDRDHKGDCEITNYVNGESNTMIRPLDEYPVFVRSNEAIKIIKRISAFKESSIADYIGTRNPYGLDTKTRGEKQPTRDSFKVHTSKGPCYINKNLVTTGFDSIDKWKTMISCICSEHAGEPNKDGMYKVLSTVKVIEPKEVCTDSYLVCYATDERSLSENFCNYLKTRFARFLILVVLSSIHITPRTMSLIPSQDFSRAWTDEELYRKYELTEDEIAFIESMIKPMDVEASDE